MQNFAILLVLIFIYFMFKLLYFLRINAISFKRYIFLNFICILAILAIITDLLGYFSDLFGIGRSVDFAIYTSILIMFFLLFKLYVAIEKSTRLNTAIIRHIAIIDAVAKYKLKSSLKR